MGIDHVMVSLSNHDSCPGMCLLRQAQHDTLRFSHMGIYGYILISNFSFLFAFKGTQEGFAVSDFQFWIFFLILDSCISTLFSDMGIYGYNKQ
jgi:hypothetical protein